MVGLVDVKKLVAVQLVYRVDQYRLQSKFQDDKAGQGHGLFRNEASMSWGVHQTKIANQLGADRRHCTIYSPTITSTTPTPVCHESGSPISAAAMAKPAMGQRNNHADALIGLSRSKNNQSNTATIDTAMASHSTAPQNRPSNVLAAPS